MTHTRTVERQEAQRQRRLEYEFLKQVKKEERQRMWANAYYDRNQVGKVVEIVSVDTYPTIEIEEGCVLIDGYGQGAMQQ